MNKEILRRQPLPTLEEYQKSRWADAHHRITRLTDAQRGDLLRGLLPLANKDARRWIETKQPGFEQVEQRLLEMHYLRQQQ